MIKWLRQLFCKHDWDAQGDMLTVAFPPMFKCKKCGKVEGL